ncbi:hypothetical protein GGI25_000166 [Coemansia spiralis]|uniref:asparaginase n=2 Tax=Coemansia TaxID=4863 RepID=A0A9W8GDK3_9FUNG|nr:hypothetical protein EDC05_002810 [Coemansia umbellata]KAJ2621824.1 hypothetical protein GGI26_003804 [Coemansia sp. RSA 1358]KAJ2681211.1 hypothetical protein GGI25_000166 [Coemansia spiralis]
MNDINPESSAASSPLGSPALSVKDADIAAHHYSETADFQRMRASLDESITRGVSKVLIIYTGGTIGMKHDKHNGYSPAKGYLPEKLRSIERFHDPNGFKDFEIEFHRSSAVHSALGQICDSASSIHRTRQISYQQQQQRQPQQQPQPISPTTDTSALIEIAERRLRDMTRTQQRLGPRVNNTESDSLSAHMGTLALQSSVNMPNINAYPMESTTDPTSSQSLLEVNAPSYDAAKAPSSVQSSPFPESQPSEHSAQKGADDGFAKNEQETDVSLRLSEWLITPRSLYGRRVQYCFLEYDPLLDSSNMDMADWVRIVTDIERFYYSFDAFVILHGTDTMSYTASALSFMLQNLGKSVIVTGSQVPIAEVRNDGIENFLGALTIAGHFVIPEVTLYFNNKLFRGNRCVKMDAMDFNAFSSPNLAPLVKVGVDIEVNWPEVLRPNAIEPFCAIKGMNSNVATLRLFPGILPTAVRAFLAPPIQGIVLETFGAGNAPDARPEILEALTEASERGTVIVNVTQCQRGNVSDLYATARGLTKAKVVPGRDMTSECALTKLSYLLGRGFTPDKCRDMLGRSLRGELTVVQSHSRPIYYSGNGRSHTFTQFVSRQILDETRANELNIESTLLDRSLSAIRLGTKQQHSNSVSIGAASSELQYSSESSPLSRESVTERASIYRSFFPVLICAAAATGDLQGMYLLEAASNNALEVTCYDYAGQTPLHCAVRAGQLPCARFLLKRGASVHVLSRQGHTPLFTAINSRHPEMVNLLLQAGAHFSDAELRDLMLSMQNAVSRGDIEFVKLCVRAGFDISASDHEGRSILYFAVIASQVEIVEYLLSLPGVSAQHWDHWGYSPMDYVLRKLDLWNELGAPHEDSLNEMQHICALFSKKVSASQSISKRKI